MPGGRHRTKREIAQALTEWALTGYTNAGLKETAKRNGISATTLWRHRKSNDPELKALQQELATEIVTHSWAAELDVALKDGIARMRYLINSSNDLPAVTEATKALSEIALTKEVLRGTTNAQQNQPTQEIPGLTANNGTNYVNGN